MRHQQLAEANEGDYVAFNISNVNKKQVRRGDVAGNSPPKRTLSFLAHIVFLNIPKNGIKV
jgi:translation elongation factor EF-1alpha